jgi:hypothetical protein
VIKFWQKLFKKEVKHYDPRSINSFIPFGIKRIADQCTIGRARCSLKLILRWIFGWGVLTGLVWLSIGTSG